jgi:hypothetical protein
VAAPAQVQPGLDVRVRVAAGSASQYSSVVGGEGRVLDGRVLENTNGDLVVGVSSVSPVTATTAVSDPTGRLFQRVSVPRDALLEVEVRRLDRTRTALVVGVLAAATAAVAITQFDHASAIEEKGKGGGQAARIPAGVFAFSLPFGR